MKNRLVDHAATVAAILLIIAAPMVLVGSALYVAVAALTALLGVSDAVALAVIGGVAAVMLLIGDELPSLVSERDRSGNPPPEVSPIKKMNLLMPVRVGEQPAKGAWPPFWGHRFPLGVGA